MSIKIWGEAYGKVEQAPSYMLSLFRFPEHDLGVDGASINGGHQWHGIFSLTGLRGRFGIEWPDALQHPLYYVGVYAAIGLMQALMSVVSVAAQYTGALRASRILFKWVYLVLPSYQLADMEMYDRQLLVTVVRATFRFHDTTPQGTVFCLPCALRRN